MEDSPKEQQNNEQPPVFSTWNRMYLFVLGFEAFLIILFYLFTLYYN